MTSRPTTQVCCRRPLKFSRHPYTISSELTDKRNRLFRYNHVLESGMLYGRKDDCICQASKGDILMPIVQPQDDHLISQLGKQKPDGFPCS